MGHQFGCGDIAWRVFHFSCHFKADIHHEQRQNFRFLLFYKETVQVASNAELDGGVNNLQLAPSFLCSWKL